MAALYMDLVPCACTALGAGLVFFTKEAKAGASPCRGAMGLAAGVMLGASVFSLLLPAVQAGRPRSLAAALGLVLGAGGLLLVEKLAGSLLAGGPGRSGRVVLAIALHNLPQGMAVGLCGALAAQGAADSLSGALALSLGLGLQNIPEGAAVSLPVRRAGASRGRAFAVGAASGLVEPLGAVLAGALAGRLAGAMPWLLGLAAGTMVCVTTQEMIPQAAAEGKRGILCVVAGFAGMLALDILL